MTRTHPGPAARRSIAAGLALAAAALLAAGAASATEPPTPPTSLKHLKRPEPANLSEFVQNKAAAIALGKALFWDMRVGSDGKTACASCHFHAGADPRSKNQLSPGPGRTSFTLGAPNYQLTAADFPFHQLQNPDDRNSAVLRSVQMVASSQGVFNERFGSVTPGSATDLRTLNVEAVFNVGGVATRKVEPRNTPTVINAVFNLRNFWDGRAQTIFNGVNPFGKRDPGAVVFKSFLPWNPLNLPNGAYTSAITLNDSSLASQAAGPPLSDLEMSAAGRSFPDLGVKMLSLRPLAGQQVAADDSVLAGWRKSDGDGLSTATYADLVRTAFQPAFWNANLNVSVKGKSYTQMQANFSLYFGLALQLYQATLVSDDTPFDRYADGNAGALTAQQVQGFGVFMGKGKCVACHGGAVFTNAAIPRNAIVGQTTRLSRMIMGDGTNALYDEGFYNIGVTRTADDLGLGGTDPFGKPLSFARLSLLNLGSAFYPNELDFPNVAVNVFGERVAVDGAFKTPTLRNVDLTAPYFHNGSVLTLEQVVDFYNRGGNFASANIANLDADIQPLGLTADEKAALVAFMKALTDERVRVHAAPFDHPELRVPNGHSASGSGVANDGSGRAAELTLVLPAVGRGGYASALVPRTFLSGVAPSANAVTCASEGGTCVLPVGRTTTVWYGAGTQWTSRVTSGSVACTNGTFGDPVVGTAKGCRYE